MKKLSKHLFYNWEFLEFGDFVLRFGIFISFWSHYLILGTGQDCAWHKRARVSPFNLSNMLAFESDENTGALKPTGSIEEI